jgi:hypothetical protein
MRGLAIRDDKSAAELRQFARTSPDRRACLRVLAIATAMDGKSRAEAAEVIGRERQSLRDAIVRYNAEGLDGLRDRPGGGAKTQLNAERCAELKAWITAGPGPGSGRRLDIPPGRHRRMGRAEMGPEIHAVRHVEAAAPDRPVMAEGAADASTGGRRSARGI